MELGDARRMRRLIRFMSLFQTEDAALLEKYLVEAYGFGRSERYLRNR